MVRGWQKSGTNLMKVVFNCFINSYTYSGGWREQNVVFNLLINFVSYYRCYR